jgi:serine/threonine-protein phosphatase 2B regulatory subunit
VLTVAFQVYDIDNDGYISNGELFMVLKQMVGSNLTPVQVGEVVELRERRERECVYEYH